MKRISIKDPPLSRGALQNITVAFLNILAAAVDDMPEDIVPEGMGENEASAFQDGFEAAQDIIRKTWNGSFRLFVLSGEVPADEELATDMFEWAKDAGLLDESLGVIQDEDQNTATYDPIVS